MRRLVFIHGRSQQMKDPDALKSSWLDSLESALPGALESVGVPRADVRIQREDVRMPYFGDTLADLVADPEGDVASVIVKGAETDASLRDYFSAVVADAASTMGLSEVVQSEVGPAAIEKGPQNWPWVLDTFRVLEKIPGFSSTSLALATFDVYQYLRNPGIQAILENGVREAFMPGEETVVVAHSLGSVIAYNLLRREAGESSLNVPSLITVGSPLGIGAISRRLAPHTRPTGLRNWFNASDSRDVVALHPIEAPYFSVPGPVENYHKVNNTTGNRHGITGYLSDSVVARKIREALTEPHA